MAWELGALGIAALLGIVWRFGQKFVPFGEVVKIISNLAVAAFLVVVTFSTIFTQISPTLLTQNVFLAWIVFLGLGYATASLIAELIGM